MLNLVSVAPSRVVKHIGVDMYRAHCGLLRSPRNTSHIEEALRLDAKWAADNDCFVGLNEKRIYSFLERTNPTGCLFFNCPDVLFDASATLKLFHLWEPVVKRCGFPAALTIQNGMHNHKIPWDQLDAIFIGSSDAYRLNSHVNYIREVILEALERNKWVHVGRAGGSRKIRYWRACGANSFDSSGFSIFPAKVKYLLPYHTNEVQAMFWELIS